MYCDVTDVQAYFQDKDFDCDTYVTSSEVTGFIAQETAYIDLKLRRKYTLPITVTNDLRVLKMICELLVVGTIDNIYREKDPTDTLERGRNYRKEGMDLLNEIADGKLDLSDGRKASLIKFNNIDSNGDEVSKQFKISDIESLSDTIDRETRSVIRVD